MFQVLIESVNRTRLVDYYSLQIIGAKTSYPNTCSFIIKKFGDRSYSPAAGDEVIIYDNDGTTKLFGGNIVDMEEVYDKLNHIGYKCRCVDYTRILDNRLVVKTYEETTVRAIIEDLKATYFDNSVTINNVEVDTEIKYVAFNYEYASDVLRQLADLADADWYIDYDRDIHFFHNKSIDAPFSLSDTNGEYVYDSLRIRRDLTQLRNVVYVRGSEYLANTITADYIADGSQQDFLLPYKFSNLQLVVTGQIRSVGVDPVDLATNFDAMHNFQEKLVRFRADKKPTIDSAVAISGNPNLPLIVKMKDQASVETFTTREHIIIDRSLRTREGARQRALAELLKYRTTLSEAEFRTYSSGLRAGQKITVQSDLRALDEEFIIDRVQASIFGTDAATGNVQLEYEVSLVTIKTFDYIQLLKRLLNEKKKEIVIDPNDVLDLVEVTNEEFSLADTVTASVEHNPISEAWSMADVATAQPVDYETIFVVGPWPRTTNYEEYKDTYSKARVLWHMDGSVGSAGKLDNAQGNSGFDLTEVNSPTAVAGYSGEVEGAYDFELGSLQYLTAANASGGALWGTSGVFKAWFKLESLGTIKYLIDDRDATNNRFFCHITAASTIQAARYGTVTTSISTSTATFTTGVWYNIVVTWKEGEPVKIYRLLEDGTYTLIASDGNNLSGATTTASPGMFIGRRFTSSGHMDGVIDEMYIGKFENLSEIKTYDTQKKRQFIITGSKIGSFD